MARASIRYATLTIVAFPKKAFPEPFAGGLYFTPAQRAEATSQS